MYLKATRCRTVSRGSLLGLLGIFTCSMALAQSFGPYAVERTFALPPFGVGDVEFANGFLYSSDFSYAYIHKLDAVTGQVLQDWSPLGAAQLSPMGLAWDGTSLWMATRNDLRLSKLDLPATGNGSVTTYFGLSASPGLPGWPMDLTYANGYFYYPEYLGPIHKIDAVTGVQVGTIPAPSSHVYGLAFDGQNLLATDGLAPHDDLWVISPEDGTVLDTWHTGIAGVSGLAYDPASHSLYLAISSTVVVATLIPEPASLTLFACALLVLCRCPRIRRR